MAHAKAATRKAKMTTYDDAPDSPHHTPITGGGNGANSDGDDADGAADGAPPPKKKKKLKLPTPIGGGGPSGMGDDGADTDGGSGPGGPGSEVEIVFKLHPSVMAAASGRAREVVDAMRDGATRYIKTTAKYKARVSRGKNNSYPSSFLSLLLLGPRSSTCPSTWPCASAWTCLPAWPPLRRRRPRRHLPSPAAQPRNQVRAGELKQAEIAALHFYALSRSMQAAVSPTW